MDDLSYIYHKTVEPAVKKYALCPNPRDGAISRTYFPPSNYEIARQNDFIHRELERLATFQKRKIRSVIERGLETETRTSSSRLPPIKLAKERILDDYEPGKVFKDSSISNRLPTQSPHPSRPSLNKVNPLKVPKIERKKRDSEMRLRFEAEENYVAQARLNKRLSSVMSHRMERFYYLQGGVANLSPRSHFQAKMLTAGPEENKTQIPDGRNASAQNDRNTETNELNDGVNDVSFNVKPAFITQSLIQKEPQSHPPTPVRSSNAPLGSEKLETVFDADNQEDETHQKDNENGINLGSIPDKISSENEKSTDEEINSVKVANVANEECEMENEAAFLPVSNEAGDAPSSSELISIPEANEENESKIKHEEVDLVSDEAKGDNGMNVKIDELQTVSERNEEDGITEVESDEVQLTSNEIDANQVTETEVTDEDHSVDGDAQKGDLEMNTDTIDDSGGTNQSQEVVHAEIDNQEETNVAADDQDEKFGVTTDDTSSQIVSNLADSESNQGQMADTETPETHN